MRGGASGTEEGGEMEGVCGGVAVDGERRRCVGGEEEREEG